MMTDNNFPKCVKCGEPALSLWNDIMVCGKCLANHYQKLKEDNQQIFMEG